MKLLKNFSLVVLRQKTDANKRLHGQKILGVPAEQWLAGALCQSFGEVVTFADIDALKKKQSDLKFENAVCLFWDTLLVREKDIAGYCDSFLRMGKQVNLPRGFIFKRDQCFDTAALNSSATGAFLSLDESTLAEVFESLRREIIARHRACGVRIWGADGLVIENGVKIAAGAEIFAPNVLRGNTVIGKNSVIHSNCDICGSKIGANCVLKSSLLTEAVVGNGCVIGPYAQLRAGSKTGKDCKIGNFVEIKNSVIGDGVKMSHLAYIGDADIGSGVNIGCGVVFVNYNGKEKFRSQIGDNVFIGSNANIIAPVKIAEYGFVAAGTTVTDNIEAGDLVIGRVRQTVKEGGGFKRLK